MPKKYLAASGLSFSLPQQEILFENLCFDLCQGEKIALVGDNGSGKSTLLKILSGALQPDFGTIGGNAAVMLVPQEVHQLSGSVGEVLGVKEILLALAAVERGEVSDEAIRTIGDNWDCSERLAAAYEEWQLPKIDLEQPFQSLSGGEKEKLLIIKALLAAPDIILLDEPSNNLDTAGRELLRRKIMEIPQGVLAVSHDRELLRQMPAVWELRQKQLTRFGGNYEFYLAEREGLRRRLEEKSGELKRESRQLCGKLEGIDSKRSRQRSYGEKQTDNRRYSRLVGNAMNAQADETAAARKKLLRAKLEQTRQEAYELSLALKVEPIKIPLPEKPHSRARLLEIKDLNFGYANKMILNNLNLLLRGGERAALCGRNGCGKTTLLKLISGQLRPTKGICRLYGRAVYLSQNLDLLQDELSILENIMRLNDGIKLNDAYKIAANFQFRNETALKKAGVLSGGERLKASLAAVLGTPKQPDIIILDEPTNNLDIRTVEVLEEALAQYQGALLAVSHDAVFLRNIKIEREINLTDF